MTPLPQKIILIATLIAITWGNATQALPIPKAKPNLGIPHITLRINPYTKTPYTPDPAPEKTSSNTKKSAPITPEATPAKVTKKINKSKITSRLETKKIPPITIQFKSNSHQLTPLAQRRLFNYSQHQLTSSNIKLMIRGYAADQEEPLYSPQLLSFKRALAIRKQLIAQGALPQHIHIYSHGNQFPASAEKGDYASIGIFHPAQNQQVTQ